MVTRCKPMFIVVVVGVSAPSAHAPSVRTSREWVPRLTRRTNWTPTTLVRLKSDRAGTTNSMNKRLISLKCLLNSFESMFILATPIPIHVKRKYKTKQQQKKTKLPFRSPRSCPWNVRVGVCWTLTACTSVLNLILFVLMKSVAVTDADSQKIRFPTAEYEQLWTKLLAVATIIVLSRYRFQSKIFSIVATTALCAFIPRQWFFHVIEWRLNSQTIIGSQWNDSTTGVPTGEPSAGAPEISNL